MPRTPSTADRRDTNGSSWTAAAGAFAGPGMSQDQSECLIKRCGFVMQNSHMGR